MCEWLSVCDCVYWSSRYVNVLKTKRRKIEKARERERGVKWKRRERETERKRERQRELYKYEKCIHINIY